MKYIKWSFKVLLLTLSIALSAHADVAIVVHRDNDNELNDYQLRKIFLGKLKTFPDGTEVVLYDLPSGTPARETFITQLLRKTEANLNSHWARMLFSSKGRPPKTLKSGTEVLDEVANNPAAIGYVDVKDLNDTVKVIQILKDR